MGSKRAPGQDRAAFVYRPDEEEGIDARVTEAERRLLPLDGVEGVGLGSDESGNEALLVYVRSEAAAANLPRRIKGLPIVACKTGEVRAY